jgi:L-ascorbate metabolism protein UlaG (beta-lactamase superfamily)
LQRPAGETLAVLEAFTWYKQSAYRWTGEQVVVYIDPWGLVGDLPPADLVLLTHAHEDHYSPDDLALIRGKKTVYVAPAGLAKEIAGARAVRPGESFTAAGVAIDVMPAYNIKPERLDFHPKANNWVGYILRLGRRTYYHAGDTDHLPELERVRTDVAFLPIGGTYTMDPTEAAGLAKAMRPKLAVPMHYGFFPGVGVARDGERFKKAAAPVDVAVLKPVVPFANT